eukprot:jgi/Mesvir1/8255/Mv12526-RA.1
MVRERGDSNHDRRNPLVVQDDDYDRRGPASHSVSINRQQEVKEAVLSVLHSWASKKFMSGCVILFPIAVTSYIAWWFLNFFDGFFSPIFLYMFGFHVFGLGFIGSMAFIFFTGVFVSSWIGASVLWLGEWFIKRVPFIKHIYSASKQISSAISPDQESKAFKECAVVRHPRKGEYAIGFITSKLTLQLPAGDKELVSVYIPTNHIYVGDVYLFSPNDIIRPNLSVREGIGFSYDIQDATCGSPAWLPSGTATMPHGITHVLAILWQQHAK